MLGAGLGKVPFTGCMAGAAERSRVSPMPVKVLALHTRPQKAHIANRTCRAEILFHVHVRNMSNLQGVQLNRNDLPVKKRLLKKTNYCANVLN